MRTWLVTGAAGFLGRHILDALAGREDDRVVGLDRALPTAAGGRSSGRVEWACADLDDAASYRRLLEGVGPDLVIHAAGRTPPADPRALYQANTLVTYRLLNELWKAGRPVRLVLVGSAAELGPVPTSALPVAESYPCQPTDPYGVSKWLATYAGLQSGPPVEVVVGRLFNLVGPGLPGGQAFGRFARILASWPAGPEPIRLPAGDLTARRDFVDVRDAAQALLALADRGRAGAVYHVGTGESRSIGAGLEELVRLSGRTVHVEADPERSNGPSDSRADAARLRADTGWAPTISWERSLADLWAAAVATVEPEARQVA